MKKKTILKLAAPLMIGSLVLAPLSPSVSAHASEKMISGSQVENEASRLMNAMDIEKLQMKANQMGLYDAEGNLTITDAQMVTLMRSQNLPIPEELKKAALQRKNGVTKVVKKKGYTYIYLSATTAKTIGSVSIGAATILTLITGGLAAGIAGVIVGTIHEVSWSYIKNGIWFKFKGFRLVGKGRQ